MLTRGIGMLAALTVIALLAGCGRGDGRGESQSDAGHDLVQQFADKEREAVTPFEAIDLDGKVVTESYFADRVAVVNVWGSWCGPCRVEAPVLSDVAAAYAPRGVVFLGLNVRDNDSAAQAFERKFDIRYPSVRSADSPKVSLAFGGRLTTAAVPMTVVLDDRGRVAARVVGKVTQATLEGLLDDLLAERPSPSDSAS